MPSLVTGASGFIGANLVRRLCEAGQEVHALMRPESDLWRLRDVSNRFTLHRVDLHDHDTLCELVCDCRPRRVFHLAAEGGHPHDAHSRRRQIASGVVGTANLLDALREIDLDTLVYAGSSTEHGPSTTAHLESDLPMPRTYRGAVKTCCTLLCQQFAQDTSASVTCLRLSSVYGYWEQPSRLIPTAIRAALIGEKLPMTPPGYVHDLVFIDDVLDAMLRASELGDGAGEVINIGTGLESTNERVVQLIGKITGREISVEPNAFPVRPIDSKRWAVSIKKARELLGWRPAHDLRKGLELTTRWFSTGPDPRYGCVAD